MSEKTYKDPSISLNRIYTKTGDGGQTRLVNGRLIPKDDLKIEAYGTVDELNSFVGMACVSARELAAAFPAMGRFADTLVRVQHELFNLGSILATDPAEIHPKQPRVTEADVAKLESDIDEMNADLDRLPSFVLPGGCRLNTELHVCRTVCRRAERIVIALSKKEDVAPDSIRYLNRLSDAFFVWSRWVCKQLGTDEVLWEPNRAASGQAE
ncbi:MAG: cob(I)yrinic acid a,c-diamide adenosyltransferase [Acidobacteria bacterium]|nr:cob(I)yrinic acid a,c-diamide adenosyltransferase [Acidobacteriota bacterium]